MIIALTGGSGAGKSDAARFFAELGAFIIDADVIAHAVVDNQARSEILQHFDVMQSNGKLDRKLLGRIVFNDKAKLAVLNSITHKYIFEEINNTIDNNSKHDIIIVDIPLLFQTEYELQYDKSIAIVADKEIRINRIMNRDSISYDEALGRLHSQLDDEEYKRRCDYVIENNADKQRLKKAVEEIYVSLIQG